MRNGLKWFLGTDFAGQQMPPRPRVINITTTIIIDIPHLLPTGLDLSYLFISCIHKKSPIESHYM